MKTPQIKSLDLRDFSSATGARNRKRRGIRPLSRENKANKPSNHTIPMSIQSPKSAKSPSPSSVGMFSAGEARCDRWQELAHAGQTLVAQSASGSSTKETLAAAEALLAPLGAGDLPCLSGGDDDDSVEGCARSARFLQLLENHQPNCEGHHHRIVSSFRELPGR